MRPRHPAGQRHLAELTQLALTKAYRHFLRGPDRDGRALRLSEPDLFLPVAIRSFLGPAADIVGASPDNTLLLTDDFRLRYLQDDRDWQKDIRPKVEDFLRAAVKKYFEDKATSERRHGKMNTWDVGRVTDMSYLFCVRTDFDEDIVAWEPGGGVCVYIFPSTRVEGSAS